MLSLDWHGCPPLKQQKEFVTFPGLTDERVWGNGEYGEMAVNEGVFVKRGSIRNALTDCKTPEDVWVLQGGFKMKNDQVFNASIGLGSGSKLLPGEALI